MSKDVNVTDKGIWNESEAWTPLDLDVFYNPDLVIIVLYVAVLSASLSANTLLIFIVVKFQYMRSVTNIFLVNLSVADLLVTLFCMPVQIAKSVTLLWYFGEVMCKTVNFLQGVAVASSVFTITAMSVDRYLAITQSLRQPWMPSRRGALVLLVVMWLVALAIFAPLLAVASVQREVVPLLRRVQNSSILVERSVEFCTEKWPASINKELYGAFSFVLVYAVPGSIVVVSYSLMGRRLCSVLPPFDQNEGSTNSQQRIRIVRERKRVALILLLLAVLFALCWLPYNIIQLLIDINAVQTESVALVLPYTLLLGHANSAINPIVYCLMTRNFRRSLRKLLCHEPGNIHSSTHFHRIRIVRERKRVALILLLLAVLFALCWLPYNIIQLLIDINAVQTESVALVLPYTLLLGHANSAINPIVYCLMTRNFRRSLRKLLCHEPGNIHSSTHFHMHGLRQKSNTSSMRTRTTVTFRSSQQLSTRNSLSPNIQYGRVPNRATSFREAGWKPEQNGATFL